MKVSFKPTPQAPRKPILQYDWGDNPVWHIDIPSHSNPSFFWTVTYSKNGMFTCNCPAHKTKNNCKHINQVMIKLGEEFLSLCLTKDNQLPLILLKEIFAKAFDKHIYFDS